MKKVIFCIRIPFMRTELIALHEASHAIICAATGYLDAVGRIVIKDRETVAPGGMAAYVEQRFAIPDLAAEAAISVAGTCGELALAGAGDGIPLGQDFTDMRKASNRVAQIAYPDRAARITTFASLLLSGGLPEHTQRLALYRQAFSELFESLVQEKVLAYLRDNRGAVRGLAMAIKTKKEVAGQEARDMLRAHRLPPLDLPHHHEIGAESVILGGAPHREP